MRPRDPRRLLERRRRVRARVQIIKLPPPGYATDGSIGSKQLAEVTLPRAVLDGIWRPENLERLARSYWRFLTRFSLGLLRVHYTPTAREVVLLARPLVLLRFDAPIYEVGPQGGTATWPINRGLLVAPAGRGRGYLRLSVTRLPDGDSAAGEATATVSSEVVQFYPMIAFGAGARYRGWISKIGRAIYNATQARLHVLVSHAFLRSLATLGLEPATMGAPMSPERPPTPAARR